MTTKLTLLALCLLCSCAKKDREDIYAEVENSDMTGAGQLMMWALRSNPDYKWVELRGKPGSATKLLVVRHTLPKQTP